jgi:aconitate hydratase
MVPKYLGIRAVIAKSFARIHVANLINFGILPFTLRDEDDYDMIDEGDEIYIEGFSDAIKNKDSATLINKTKNREVKLKLSLTDRQRKILLAGGMLEYTKLSN